MSVSLPYPEPDWIYEGYDASKFEDATGIVTNRAPKQIQENVIRIRDNINKDLDPRLIILEQLRLIYRDSPVYSNSETYKEWFVVNDGNGIPYISAANDNLNHPLSDRDWWVPVNIWINDDIVDEFHCWSSAKLEEYLINHGFDSTQIPIYGGNAEQDTAHNLIQQRYDTAENWNSHNPILAKGEIGIELNADGSTTNAKFKIGDGVSTWDQLQYSNDKQWVIDYIEGNGGGTGGDMPENNLVHRTGDETIRGKKTFTDEIIGTVSASKWSDLAEYYEADAQYSPGTLIKFGGLKEITASDRFNVNGVISTQPGFILNADVRNKENWYPIALSGRVPVLIQGKVDKFDYIIASTINGIGAPVKNPTDYDLVIGRALEENHNSETKLVLCVTQFNLGK